jgi:hypothetical protein
MGKLFIGLLALVVGFVGGAVIGGSLLAGAGTGAGIATGLSAGICSTVLAATAEGLLTEEEVEQVLARAAADLGGTVDAETLTGTTDRCDEVMQELMESAAN